MTEYKRHRSSYDEDVKLAAGTNVQFAQYGYARSNYMWFDFITGELVEPDGYFSIMLSSGKEISIPFSAITHLFYFKNGYAQLFSWDVTPFLTEYLTARMSGFSEVKPGAESTYVRSVVERQSYDNPTPNFKAIRDSGGIVNTACKFERSSVLVSQPGLTTKVTSGQINVIMGGQNSVINGKTFIDIGVTGRCSAVLEPHAPTVADVRNLLDRSPPLHRASSDLAVARVTSNMTAGTLESLVTLGESQKTVAHLAQTAARIARIVRAIKSGNFRAIAPQTWHGYLAKKKKVPTTNVLDFFNDAWLEARYAWRPLIIDAENVVKLLQSDHQMAPRKTFRGLYNEELPSVTEEASLFFNGKTYRGTVTTELRSTVRAGILAQPKMNNSLGHELGALNFGSLVWELIPYSFVVGWFVNVSSILDRANFQAAFESLAEWLTFTDTCKQTYTMTHVNDTALSSPVTITVTKSVKTRDPGLPVGKPFINIDLDVFKLIDMVALLRKLV